MEKSIKIVLIIIAVLVGLLVLSSVLGLISNLFNFLEKNQTTILVVVAITSGLLLFMTEREDNSGLRSIAFLLLFFSIINLIGGFVGNLIEQVVGLFFK